MCRLHQQPAETPDKENNTMQAILRVTAIGLALVGSAGLTGAAQLNLTSAQKQTIAQGVASERGETAPSGFLAKIGEKVPQSLSMHQLPSSVTNQVSAAKGYEYAKLQNQVVVVDPKTRKVIGTVSGS